MSVREALEELEAERWTVRSDPLAREVYLTPGGREIVQSRNEELAASAVAARRLERWKANLKKTLPSRT